MMRVKKILANLPTKSFSCYEGPIDDLGPILISKIIQPHFMKMLKMLSPDENNIILIKTSVYCIKQGISRFQFGYRFGLPRISLYVGFYTFINIIFFKLNIQ